MPDRRSERALAHIDAILDGDDPMVESVVNGLRKARNAENLDARLAALQGARIDARRLSRAIQSLCITFSDEARTRALAGLVQLGTDVDEPA